MARLDTCEEMMAVMKDDLATVPAWLLAALPNEETEAEETENLPLGIW